MSKVGQEFLLSLSNRADDLFQQGDYWRRVTELNREYDASDDGASWLIAVHGLVRDDLRLPQVDLSPLYDKLQMVFRDYQPPNVALALDLLKDDNKVGRPNREEKRLLDYRLLTLIHDGFGHHERLIDDWGEAAYLASDYLKNMAESEAGRGYLDSAFNRVREELLSQDSIHAMTTFLALRQQVDDVIRTNHSPQIAHDRLYEIQCRASELCIGLAQVGKFSLLPDLANVKIPLKRRRGYLYDLLGFPINNLMKKHPNENLHLPSDAFEWVVGTPESGQGVQTPERWLAVAHWLRRVLDLLAKECGETGSGGGTTDVAAPIKTQTVTEDRFPVASMSGAAPHADGSDGTPSGATESELEQPPALTEPQRITLGTLNSFDSSMLVSAADVSDAMPATQRLSERTTREAIKRLVKLGFAERPEGEKQGARLTIRGRRLAAKIAD